MQIHEIEYRRLFNLGNYENETIGARASVQPGETEAQVMDGLRAWVEAQHQQHEALRTQACALETDVRRISQIYTQRYHSARGILVSTDQLLMRFKEFLQEVERLGFDTAPAQGSLDHYEEMFQLQQEAFQKFSPYPECTDDDKKPDPLDPDEYPDTDTDDDW